MSKLAVLILAAGNSSRMGSPKQLLKWKNTTLLQHSINSVKAINDINILVLGANFEKIEPSIISDDIIILQNKHWQKGLGNSIAAGVQYVKESLPNVDNILIVLGDQPLINSDYLKKMIGIHKLNREKLICTMYEKGRLGVPAIFNNSFFEELLQLNDDKGAKNILQMYSDRMLSVHGENLISDIDTIDDYELLYKKHH